MRETKQITFTSGKTAKIRTFLTAREVRELRLTKEKMTAFGFDVETNKPFIKQADMGSIEKEREDCLVRFAFAEYDGSEADVLERLLDAPPGDFDEAVAEANKLTESPKGQK